MDLTSGFIPQDTIEEIKARTDIVTIVEQYVTLSKKSRQNFFGLCPFHSEDTASFSVSPSKQIFYCFGCHKGGDVVRFIQEIEHLSYPEALRNLAERVGITIEQSSDPFYQEKRDHRHRIEDLYVEAARFFYHNLMSAEGKVTRQYLHRRGITDKTIKQFGLGYADSSWDGLLKHLEKNGYRQQEIQDSGLFRESRHNTTIDLFRERLMFPIISGTGKGKIVAFGGRVLDDSMPKYINSPETLIYTKGKHLYGLNLAKRSRDKRILLVEGYMDCLSVFQGGIDNVVAVLGTALTEQQARLLRQQTDHVILALDADRAGQQATLRAIDVLAKERLKVTVLQIPDGKDPDQFIQEHGSERFKALMDSSMPTHDYQLSVAWKLANEGQQLDIAVLQDEVCKVLEGIDNNILFEVYIAKAASMLGIQIDAVRAELQRRKRLSNDDRKTVRQSEYMATSNREDLVEQEGTGSGLEHVHLSRDEAYLLILLAFNPEVYPSLITKPKPEYFLAYEDELESAGTKWILRLFELIEEGKLSITTLLSESIGLSLQGKELTDVLAETTMKLPDQEALASLVSEATRYELAVRLDSLTRLRTTLLTQMGSQALTEEERSDLRGRYMETEKALQALRR